MTSWAILGVPLCRALTQQINHSKRRYERRMAQGPAMGRDLQGSCPCAKIVLVCSCKTTQDLCLTNVLWHKHLWTRVRVISAVLSWQRSAFPLHRATVNLVLSIVTHSRGVIVLVFTARQKEGLVALQQLMDLLQHKLSQTRGHFIRRTGLQSSKVYAPINLLIYNKESHDTLFWLQCSYFSGIQHPNDTLVYLCINDVSSNVLNTVHILHHM